MEDYGLKAFMQFGEKPDCFGSFEYFEDLKHKALSVHISSELF